MRATSNPGGPGHQWDLNVSAMLFGEAAATARGQVTTGPMGLELEVGLDELDRRYLRTIADFYDGGPVGIEALAATLNEDRDTLEDVVEPYLLQIGFLARTRQGRRLTAAGAAHVGSSAGAAGGELFQE